MEELKQSGFDNTYCLTLVDDKNFYSGKMIDGIYSFFRAGKIIAGTIDKPTGKNIQSITLSDEYQISWKPCNDMQYYILKL